MGFTLDGAVPTDLYAAGQSGISLQLSSIVERLSRMTIHFSELERNLSDAMELLRNCYEAYRRAPDDVRQLDRRLKLQQFRCNRVKATGFPMSSSSSAGRSYPDGVLQFLLTATENRATSAGQSSPHCNATINGHAVHAVRKLEVHQSVPEYGEEFGGDRVNEPHIRCRR